jgi:hypothetical protein
LSNRQTLERLFVTSRFSEGHGGVMRKKRPAARVARKEHWVEINMAAKLEDQDAILLDVLRPHVRRLRRARVLVSWHYFREPEIRFRVRVGSENARAREGKTLSRIARSLKRKGLVSEWHFGNHGDRSETYTGEEDRYGKNGWRVAQEYFERGAETALDLLELRRKTRLENPLWARGLGNPWEGGDRNPWREREEDPRFYHWSRYVHLFTNQMGFNVDEESRLCGKQAERYSRISKEFGMKW